MQWQVWAVGVFFTFGFSIMGLLYNKAEKTASAANDTAKAATEKADAALDIAHVLQQQLCDHIDGAEKKFDMFEKHADERHRDIKAVLTELKEDVKASRN